MPNFGSLPAALANDAGRRTLISLRLSLATRQALADHSFPRAGRLWVLCAFAPLAEPERPEAPPGPSSQSQSASSIAAGSCFLADHAAAAVGRGWSAGATRDPQPVMRTLATWVRSRWATTQRRWAGVGMTWQWPAEQLPAHQPPGRRWMAPVVPGPVPAAKAKGGQRGAKGLGEGPGRRPSKIKGAISVFGRGATAVPAAAPAPRSHPAPPPGLVGSLASSSPLFSLDNIVPFALDISPSIHARSASSCNS